MEKIRNFKQGIKNLFNWIPLIWSDRDYDYTYTYKILRHKLNSQANHLEKQNRHVGTEYYVSRIRLCVKLLDKLIEDYYGLEYYEYENNLDIYFERYKSVLRREKIEYHNDIHLAISLSDTNNERAKKLLFKLMDKHIESWWN